MKRIIGKFAFFSLVLALSSNQYLNAQEKYSVTQAEKDVTLFFSFNKAIVDSTYMSNRSGLLKLDSLLHNKRILAGIDSLSISAYASPEGAPAYNQQLAARRAAAINEYILQKYPFMSEYPIRKLPMGENWEGLRQLVLKDLFLPGRSQVLAILNEPIGSVEKETRIKAINDGASWRYIERNMLRFLRGSSFIMFYLDPVKMAIADTMALNENTPVVEQPAIIMPAPVQEIPEKICLPHLVRPVAFKTNLLFDAVTALNFEVEVPVAKRFSIAGEWIFPWWLWENKQNCLEVLSGNLEARYWFRPNFAKQDPSLGLHNPLTGWFVGVYGGGGKYDLEWKREGYQGEFFIATGVSGGYVLPLNRNISMEFSLGLGIMRTKYRHYHAEFCDIDNRWHLIRQFNGRHTWIGPTKAKISFIWYPHFKVKKRGGNL